MSSDALRAAQAHLAALRQTAQAENLDAFLDHLHRGGLRAALQYLNRGAPHRFTGVFRFDGDMLRSVELVDKWSADVTQGEDIPLVQAYCSHLHDTGEPLAVSDGATDSRTRWMANSGVRSYSGALIRSDTGLPWGAVCHFDADPCDVSAASLPMLVAAASLLFSSASAR